MDTIKSLVPLFFIVAAIFGYIMNLVFLFNIETLNGELIVRSIGILFPPLGAILGFVP